jgi:hypothetical protein
VFTPKHGSWLNLAEGFSSEMPRSMLRHIGVASRFQLKARVLAYLNNINAESAFDTWPYNNGKAA